MKKTLIMTMFTFCVTIEAIAQKYISSMLIGTWLFVAPIYPNSSEEEFLIFKKKELVNKYVFHEYDKTFVYQYSFYLFPMPPVSFDHSLVGERTCGKYLVMELDNKKFIAWEIMELTKNRLKIKKLPYNDIYTYKKVK